MRPLSYVPCKHFYQPPTAQSSWSKRPCHVSMSSSLWTDLLMVGMLFRLNEFTLAHLIGGFSGFWLPVSIFFAVFDAWETRVLFDSVFKYRGDLVHYFFGVAQWLMIALMATAVTPKRTWDHLDTLLFAGLKLAHHTLRLFNYVEICLMSRSHRDRKAAKVHCIPHAASWPLSLTALVLVATHGVSNDIIGAMWVAGFFCHRVVWSFLLSSVASKLFGPHLRHNANAVRTNISFRVTRYGDWTMLQLGCIVLGSMTVPATTLGSYGVLIFGYIYIAALNLLSFSMNPSDPTQHALMKGGLREFTWLLLFALGGVAFMGIAVGLRVHLIYLTAVVLPQNRHYTWLLCSSAAISAYSMFGQEYCHGGKISRVLGTKTMWLKIVAASLYIVVGAIFIKTNASKVAFAILGIALVAVVVLAIQVMNGAFKRQILRSIECKYMGHFYAAIIGTILLSRARKRLDAADKRNQWILSGALAFAPGRALTSVTPTLIQHKTRSESLQKATVSNNQDNVGQTAENSTATHQNPLGDDVLSHQSLPRRPHSHDGVMSPPQPKQVTTSLRRSSRSHAQRLTTMVNHDIQVWRVVLNDRFYARPHIYVEGNKATKYCVQWSDLFFDILFVGVVFRLGDLLLAGLGAGFSESSVHYGEAMGGTNETAYSPPNDASRTDAIFVFSSVFVAVFAMWQNKLSYSSKVGSGDVVHKIIESIQGLAVLLCAVNITTPNQLEDPSTSHAYGVASSLLVFQLSMVGLWVELLVSEGPKDSRAKGTALRNIQRDVFTLLPLACSFASIRTRAPLSVTTFLWSLSWLLPFLMRVAVVRIVNDHNSVRDLHRYVIHRLGDGALIVLGEGILQIIRAETNPGVYAYITISLGLSVMTATRIAVWSMDCFTNPAKHAQLLSLDAGLAAYFIRSISAPALVAMGVALKKMINITSAEFSPKNTQYYWLLCGASTVSLFTLVVTYELHRFSYHREWRKRAFFGMTMISLIFICVPPIPIPTWAIVILTLVIWLLSIVVHFFLDDYFAPEERARRQGSGGRSSTGSERYAQSKETPQLWCLNCFNAGNMRGNRSVATTSASIPNEIPESNNDQFVKVTMEPGAEDPRMVIQDTDEVYESIV